MPISGVFSLFSFVASVILGASSLILLDCV